MSEVKIETLTPIHIGNGNFLQCDTDFVTTATSQNTFIRVIDDKKVLGLIGEQRVNDWLLSIERKENLKDFLKRFAPNAKPGDYSKRRLVCLAKKVSSGDTLKECLHNGLGMPYIPGSSLKGAIRTVVRASLVPSVPDLENLIRNKKGKITADRVENKLFGDDPKNDIFRFVTVGDAYFREECEIATRLVNLNITQRKELMDKSKPQLIEAIRTDESAILQMKIAVGYYDWVRKHNDKTGKMPVEMQTIGGLFSLINAQTKKLLAEEIEYWKEVGRELIGAKQYIENLQQVMVDIDACEPQRQCVLRLGHASGWRFITGAWAEKLDCFNEVINQARYNNKNYSEYDFPKSRRLDENSDILGFVKLTACGE